MDSVIMILRLHTEYSTAVSSLNALNKICAKAENRKDTMRSHPVIHCRIHISISFAATSGKYISKAPLHEAIFF